MEERCLEAPRWKRVRILSTLDEHPGKPTIGAGADLALGLGALLGSTETEIWQ